MATTTSPPDTGGWLRRRARAWREVMGPVRARLVDVDAMLVAAALTFYAAIAIIPLLLLAVFLAQLLLGHEALAGLGARVAEVAPDGLQFDQRLAALIEAGTDLPWIAVAAALVPATTYGEGLLRAFDRIAKRRTPRRGLRGRVRSLALLGLLPLLVIGGLATVAVLSSVLGGAGWTILLGGYLAFWAAWIGASALLAVTFRAFSPVRIDRRSLGEGSVVTGSFLAGMSLGWVGVLRFDLQVGQAYGGSEPLGAAVLFVVYLYLVQVACLAGYAATLALSDRRDGR